MPAHERRRNCQLHRYNGTSWSSVLTVYCTKCNAAAPQLLPQPSPFLHTHMSTSTVGYPQGASNAWQCWPEAARQRSKQATMPCWLFIGAQNWLWLQPANHNKKTYLRQAHSVQTQQTSRSGGGVPATNNNWVTWQRCCSRTCMVVQHTSKLTNYSSTVQRETTACQKGMQDKALHSTGNLAKQATRPSHTKPLHVQALA